MGRFERFKKNASEKPSLLWGTITIIVLVTIALWIGYDTLRIIISSYD